MVDNPELAAALARCAEIDAASAERLGPNADERIAAALKLRHEQEDKAASLARRRDFITRHPRVPDNQPKETQMPTPSKKAAKRRPPSPPRTTTHNVKSIPAADLQPKTTPASRQITDGPGVVVVHGKGI